MPVTIPSVFYTQYAWDMSGTFNTKESKRNILKSLVNFPQMASQSPTEWYSSQRPSTPYVDDPNLRIPKSNRNHDEHTIN